MASVSNICGSDDFHGVPRIVLFCYEHNIQFYKNEVKGIINIEDLKEYGFWRLNILRIVREIVSVNEFLEPEEYCVQLIARLEEDEIELANVFFDASCEFDDIWDCRWARWKDHVSYNVVCLALSQKPETRSWLQEMELHLLKWKMMIMDDEEIEDFLNDHKIRYPMVDEDQKICLKDQLIAGLDDPEDFDEIIFYKVPYREALGAIATHKVYVKSGIAYLTLPHLRSAILYRFKCHLETQMKSFKRDYCKISDSRIHDLTEFLQYVHCDFEAMAWKIGITPIEDLDRLAVTCYPPCMRKLHEALRENHHLRNQGRIQYTLFLKAIGVTAEAAVDFYRKEFTLIMDENDFEKEYAYYFLHLYGLVGGKKDYDLYDCSKAAKIPVGDDEYHGCAFAPGDIEDFDEMLDRFEIPSTHKGRIIQLTNNKKCDEACSAFFEATHGCSITRPIVNPIDFYGQSREVCDSGRKARARENAKRDGYMVDSDSDSFESDYPFQDDKYLDEIEEKLREMSVNEKHMDDIMTSDEEIIEGLLGLDISMDVQENENRVGAPNKDSEKCVTCLDYHLISKFFGILLTQLSITL